MYWPISPGLNGWNLPQGANFKELGHRHEKSVQWYLNTLALQAAQEEKAQVAVCLEKGRE